MMKLAEKNTGMNWEIAALKMSTVQEVLESAQEEFPHTCEVDIETREESDGGPYQCNKAPHYYLVVNGPEDTDPRFIKGIEAVLAAV
jgi:hypothetical protein